MKQNLNPEPSGSPKSRHVPYLRALCSILLALLFSSCDDFITSTGSANFSFSGAGDSETIIGMREFLLTASYPKDGELSFVVTDSPSAPAWSDVASTTSKQVRKFNNSDKQKRELYFSLTSEYSATFTSRQRGVVKEIQTDASGKQIVTWNAPPNRYTPPADEKYSPPAGFMTPNKTYYAYAYENGALLGQSEPITLSDYPSTLPVQVPEGDKSVWPADPPYAPSSAEASGAKKASIGAYLWGMSAWRRSDGGLRDREVRIGEVSVFPIRLIRPIKSAEFDGGETYGPCASGTTAAAIVLLVRRGGTSGTFGAFYTINRNDARAPWGDASGGVPWPVSMTDLDEGAVARQDFLDFVLYLGFTSDSAIPGGGGTLDPAYAYSTHAYNNDQASAADMQLEMTCSDSNFRLMVTNVGWTITYVTE